MSVEGARGESGWSQTRVPNPVLQNPECQQLGKESPEVPGTDGNWGGALICD